MSYEEKPGFGTLFVNDKRGNPSAPDRSGYVLAHRDIKAGEKVRLAGWIKGGDGGRDKFLSLKMSDMRGASAEPAPRHAEAPADDMDESIPF